MKLSQNTRVVFTEDPHSYTLDGVTPLLGVTSLMAKHGLNANYGGISKETLDNAAALGSMAHQVIENYCNGLPVVMTPLLKSFAALGLRIIQTEYLVSDNATVASKIDAVEAVGENEVVLWDFKRTSSVHRGPLAWQLGIYKQLFEAANPEIKVVGCKCLPIKKGSTTDIDKDVCGEPVEINPMAAKEVAELMRCEAAGVLYQQKAQDNTEELVALFGSQALADASDAADRLAEATATVKMLEAGLSEFKEKAYQYMLENNKDTLVCGCIELKLKRPYNSSRFDTTKFKKDYPDMAKIYTNVAETKGNVSINIK